MNQAIAVTQRGSGRVKIWLAARAGELAVGALMWFGVHEFAHLRLTPMEWAGLWAGSGTLWTVSALARAARPAGSWVWLATECLGPGAALLAVNARLSHPLTTGQLLYVTLAVGAPVVGWRAWAAWRVRRGADPVAEPWRVLLVGAAPLLALLPFFSDRLIGGTDARWYAAMLRDFIDQLRAGIFPVFIGQGEFAWNGGVHPFRSAPVYMHVAGFWDLLSWRALNAPALQHLTVLTAGLVGALGFYAAAAALLPARRWVAAGFAVLYAVAPAWLGVLYAAEAYMTFMALGAVPAVLYGNARSLLTEDGRGYGWLAAGLALVWMCHPPTAMMSTLLTVLLQGGSFLLGRAPGARWRGVAGGVLLFGGLAAYYFAGMSELPKAPGVGRQDVLQLAGPMLALAGLGNGFLLGRSRWWLVAVPVGAGLAWLGRTPWLGWIGVTALLVAVAAALGRRRHRVALADYAVVILGCALVVGAGVTQAWVGAEHPARNQAALGILKANASHAMELFRPVTAQLGGEGKYQPGVGLWLVLLGLAWAFVRPGALAVKLFFVAAALPLLGVLPVPWVSEFLVGYAPNGLAQVISLPLTIRMLPIITGMAAMGGVVWVATWLPGKAGRGRRGAAAGLLIAAAAWGLVQTAPFIRSGWSVTESRSRTVDKFRPENAALERFAYDLLQAPAYLTQGWIDPWVQARLLDPVEQVVVGPDETARVMEQSGARRVRLTARTEPNNPAWVHLAPDIVVAPGERLFVRFEFDPKINYAGWLIWAAAHGYREYHLPASGLALAFGTEAPNSRVVVLGNSTDQPANYHLTLSREPGNTLVGNGDFFAEAVLSRYESARAGIRVESLMPVYRVTATAAAAGWIETSRVWLPGYRATLDGRPVELKASHRGLAMAAVPPGAHTLELRYVGTAKLWAALVVSALTWLGWLGWTGRRIWRGGPAG